MPGNQTIANRYEIQLPAIGQGGMGVVFRAYDSVTRRHVAVKTLRGGIEHSDLKLFEKEWTVLARISHPNIVDILDTGEFQEEGQSKPFFVMPLLPGQTLDNLIRDRSPRLTVERTVDILAQACRGLQAAHDQGLVHRDLKPSNIFVMDDDAVKIIDFGVVHLSDGRTFTGVKGTVDYMAPEQMEFKATTAQSDIFSLGVVAYEALTGQRPFAGFRESELIEAIRSHIPSPASEINPQVSQTLSQTVQKAMAKQPFHRYESAREFAETLQRAARNERIERFDASRVQPRIERIKKAFQEEDFQFAWEILTELEAEGYMDAEMPTLRAQIDHAIRSKKVRELLDISRARFDEEEYPLALQKVQEALELDPTNIEAIAIKSKVERHRSEKQLGTWFDSIRQQLDRGNFTEARRGIDEVFRISPSNARGRELLREIERREQEVQKNRQEKEGLYQSALANYRGGELDTALREMERALSIMRRIPEGAATGHDAEYQALYEEIRQQQLKSQAAYREAQSLLAVREYGKTIAVCEEQLARQAGDTRFQALKLEAEDQERREQSSALADVTHRLEEEPDLDRRLGILQEAVERYPKESHFQQSLKLIRDRRDLLNSVVIRAQRYEERGQIGEALAQWEIVWSVDPHHPNVATQRARLERRLDQQARDQANAERVEEFDWRVIAGDWPAALRIAKDSLDASPDSQEWRGLLKLAEQGSARSQETARVIEQAQSDFAEGNHESGLAKLRTAYETDRRNAATYSALLNALIDRARIFIAVNWRAAEPYVKEAQEMAPDEPSARSLVVALDEQRIRESVGEIVLEAHGLQTAGDYKSALDLVERGLASYPNDARLSQLQWNLQTALRVVTSSHGIFPAPLPLPARSDAESTPGQAGMQAVQPPNAASVVGAPTPSTSSRREAEENRETPGIKPPDSTPSLSPLLMPTKPPGSVADSPPERRFRLLMAMGGLLVVAMAGLAILTLRKSGAVLFGPSSISVQVRAAPANAHLLLDGKPIESSFSVKPGTYQLSAALDGYRPVTEPLTITSDTNSPVVVPVTLEALPLELRINSDLKGGRVFIDGKRGNLLDGGFLTSDIMPGRHTVSITDGRKNVVAFNFMAEPGKAATIESLNAKSVPALIVSTFSNRATAWATGGLKGGRSPGALGTIPAAGLDLPLSSGENEFFLDNGKGREKITLETSQSARVSVTLGSAREIGTLVLHANVQDATVLLDGLPLRRRLASGSVMLDLEPKTYRLQLQSDGYQSSAEQSIELKAGDSKTLRFELVPTIGKGTLTFEKLPPDTEVTIDGRRIGTTASDGSLKLDVPSGNHSVSLRKQGYEEITFSREVLSNSRTVIAGDIVMRALGTVLVKIAPPSAKVTYHRDGETQSHEAANGQSLSLKSANYEFTVQADKYEQRSQSVAVSPGKSVNVEIALAPKEQRETNVGHTLAAVVLDPKEWTSTDGWWEHPAQTYGWFKANQGSFSVDFLKRSSRVFFVSKTKRVGWVADYRDEANRIVYELDDHQLRRHAVVNNKSEPEVKAAHAITSPIMWQVEIEISADHIVVKERNGKVLDEYRRPKPQVPLGKFGFRGPVALALPNGH